MLTSDLKIQPRGRVRIKDYWRARGLQLAFCGDGTLYDGVTGQFTRLNPENSHARFIQTKYGLATGFGSLAGGANYIVNNNSGKFLLERPKSNYRTIVACYMAVGPGGGNFGRLFQDPSGNGLSFGESMYFSNEQRMCYNRDYNSGDTIQMRANSTLASPPFGVPVVMAFTRMDDSRTDMGNWYINGDFVPGQLITDFGASGPRMTPTNLSFGNRSSDWARSFDGWIGPILFFDGQLTAAEHRMLADNPWQIFEEDLTFPWLIAGGGMTTVTADLVQAYAASSIIVVDFGQSYQARQTVQADAAQSYAALQTVTADAAQSYAAVSRVTADLVQSYGAAGAVTSDMPQSYVSNATVQADLVQSYVGHQTVVSDAAQAYAARAYVNSDLAQSYGAAGVASSDLAQSYVSRQSVIADMPQSYVAVESAPTQVTSDFPQSYQAVGRVVSDLAQSYEARTTVTIDLAQSYASRQIVVADSAQSYVGRMLVENDSVQTYNSRMLVSADKPQSYQAYAEGGISLQHSAWLEAVARANGLIDTMQVSATQRSDGTLVQSLTEAAGSITLTTLQGPAGAAGVSSLTPQQAQWLELLARHHGLIAPLVVTDTGETDGVLSLSTTTTGGVTTVARV